LQEGILGMKPNMEFFGHGTVSFLRFCNDFWLVQVNLDIDKLLWLKTVVL
jgi:hypothetical protein